MRRALLRCAGAFALMAGLAAPVAAQSVVFGVARDGSGFLYEELALPFWADMTGAGGARLGSYTARLTWDPAVLNYAGMRQGAFADPLLRTDSTYLGILWIAAVSASGADGFVDLGHVRFTPYAEATSAVAITLTEASAAGTFADLLPLVTTSAGVYCPAQGRWGDTDSDGDANSRDALAVLSDVVGIAPGIGFDMALGDADGDGATNTRDALILLSYAVGLDISGQRVMTVAPGPCAIQGGLSVQVAPNVIEVVVGQRTALRATSYTDGVPTVLNGLNWLVDDPRIGAMDPDSYEFIARDTGSTTLRAALGPGIEATVPVTVLPRRPVWHVDGAVARGSIALGTAAYPFWTPQQAFPFLREGDTIRVAPGAVDYDSDFGDDVFTGFVLQGVLLPDSTRPVLRAPAECCYAAYMYNYYYDGAGAGAAERRRVEFHDVELHNFQAALYAEGLSALVMRNVDVRLNENGYDYGVEVDNPADTIDLERVRFLGVPGGSLGDAMFLEGGSFLRFVDVTVADLSGGIAINDGVDSLHVDRGTFMNVGYDALGLYGNDRITQGIYVANTRAVNAVRGLAAYEVLRARLVNNVWESPTSQAIQLYAPDIPVGPVIYRITGDSVRSPDYNSNWIEAYRFDSLLVSDVHVRIDTSFVYMYVYGGHAAFRQTVLEGASYEGFDLDVVSATFDTVSVRGCATCAYSNVSGIYVRPYGAGPTVTVRGGAFTSLYEGINIVNPIVPGPLQVSGALIDSVQYGIRGAVDSVVLIANRIMTSRATAIDIRPSGDRPASQFYRFQGNHVACKDTTGTQYGLYAERTAMVFEGNFVENCDYGMYVSNSLATILDVSFTGDSVFATPAATRGIYVVSRWRPTLYGVRTRGAAYGIDIATNDTATVRIDSSAVSEAASAGLRLGPPSGTVATGVRNNVTNNALDGILNATNGPRSFTLGRFVGNARWAINSTTSFDARNNYWGPLGPGPGVAGDSSTAIVGDSSAVLTDPADVPAAGAAPGRAVTAGAAVVAPGQPPVITPAPGAGRAEPAAGPGTRERQRRPPPPRRD